MIRKFEFNWRFLTRFPQDYTNYNRAFRARQNRASLASPQRREGRQVALFLRRVPA